MNPAIVGGLARAFLAAFGGWLAARGLTVDQSTAEAIVGAGAVVVTAVWSVWSKRGLPAP
jgi:hypothetical protein